MPPRMTIATAPSVLAFSRAPGRFFFCRARNHEHTLAVGVQQVSGFDACTADLDRAAVIDDLSAYALVLRVDATAEHRETLAFDLVRVAHIAIENRAGRLQMGGPCAHEPTHNA